MASNNNSLGNQLLTDKENIRKNIRNGLTYKKPYQSPVPDFKPEVSTEAQEHPLVQFVNHFRGAGGKYIPCTKENLVSRLVKIAQGQQYSTLLNTSPNIGYYLQKYQVRHVNSINPMETVDAALFFSDMLVASTGAVGFTQSVSLYPSVRNLARDIIIVSRQRCIFPTMEDAIAYQQNRNNNSSVPIFEFLTPTQPILVEEKETYTPQNPRFILMLVEDNPVTKKSEDSEQPSNDTQHDA